MKFGPRVINHRDTKTQRKAAKKIVDAAFLCVFVSLWLCHNPAQTMIYDVTIPISNSMPVWPGDPPVRLTAKSHASRDKTHTVRLTAIEMASHTGTHIDAPFHMMENGKRLDEFPLDVFTGKATVFEISVSRCIRRQDLAPLNWKG